MENPYTPPKRPSLDPWSLLHPIKPHPKEDPESEIEPLGFQTTYEYGKSDPTQDGRLCSFAWAKVCDVDNRLVAMVDTSGHRTTFSNGRSGDSAAQSDAEFTITTHPIDFRGNQADKQFPAGAISLIRHFRYF